MTEIDIVRTNHLIDPALHIWGWEIPVYLFLGGLAAGIMILAAIHRRQRPPASASLKFLPFLAPIFLSIGMGALFLDLEYKLHVYRFYLAFQISSPMSWGSWILLAIYPATLLFGLMDLEKLPHPALRRIQQFAKNHERSILNANIALGIALGIYTGILLSSLGRPAWDSAILGPLFLASGISGGAALALLLPLAPTEHHTFKTWDQTAMIAELVCICLFVSALSGTDLFTGGPYTAVFWSLIVGMGLLAPFAIELVENRRKLSPTRVAPALILAGGFALRWILVMGGQAS